MWGGEEITSDVGVGEDLALLIKDVDGYENQTQLDASEIDVDHLQRVG
jgi:serine/threonine protein kinase HipA of HipAB toxin-antitoxin module